MLKDRVVFNRLYAKCHSILRGGILWIFWSICGPDGSHMVYRAVYFGEGYLYSGSHIDTTAFMCIIYNWYKFRRKTMSNPLRPQAYTPVSYGMTENDKGHHFRRSDLITTMKYILDDDRLISQRSQEFLSYLEEV